MIVARILDSHELGLFSASVAIIAVAELFAENGIGDAVVQKDRLNDRTLCATMLINLGVSGLLALCLWLGAGRLEDYFHAPGLASLLPWMGLALIFNGASYIAQSLFRRRLEYRWLAMRALVSTLLGGVVGVSLAFLGFGAWSMVGQALIVAIANAGFVWARPPFDPRVRPDFHGAAALLRFGGSLLVGRIFYYLSTRVVELVILYKYGATLLSYYIIGSRFYSVGAQMLVAVLLDVSFSSLARLRDDRAQLEAAFLRNMRIATGVSVPFFLGMAAIANEISVVAFGSKGVTAAPFTLVVSLFGAVQVMNFFMDSVLSVLGKPMLATAILGFRSLLAACILFPPWPIDPVHLVALNAATLLIVMPMYMAACSRFGGFDWKAILKAIGPAYAAGGAMFGIVWLARLPLIYLLPSPLLRGVALAGLGAIIYVGLMAMLAPDTLRQMRAMRRRGKDRGKA